MALQAVVLAWNSKPGPLLSAPLGLLLIQKGLMPHLVPRPAPTQQQHYVTDDGDFSHNHVFGSFALCNLHGAFNINSVRTGR